MEPTEVVDLTVTRAEACRRLTELYGFVDTGDPKPPVKVSVAAHVPGFIRDGVEQAAIQASIAATNAYVQTEIAKMLEIANKPGTR